MSQTVDEKISERILKSGEKLPPTITIEPGRLFDGDFKVRYTTGPEGKLPTMNEFGALGTLFGRVDRLNPRYRYDGGYLLRYLEICLMDNRIYTWQEVQPRILSWLRGQNGF
jgi:hypothetical protein